MASKTTPQNTKATPVKKAASPTRQPRTKSSLRGLAEVTKFVKRRDRYSVDPLHIQIKEGFNIRDFTGPATREHIDQFKHSIREYLTRNDPENRMSEDGLADVIPELIIRIEPDGEISLVDGQHRLTAIRELIEEEGFTIKLVEVKASAEDEAGLTLIQLRTAQTKPHSPLEKGRGYLRLMEDPVRKRSYGDIAKEVGTTAQRVEQLILLARGPAAVTDMVQAGDVTADAAIEVLRQHRDAPAEAARVLNAHVAANTGTKPVGRNQTSLAIPKKLQATIYESVTSRTAELNRTLSALVKKGGDWEDELVAVQLPAGVIQQLLDKQKKQSEADAAEPAADA